jgi:formate/nitrite transporter FocA (FNT family)
MLPVLHKTHGPPDLVRYWAIVFVGNIVATLLFAAAMTIPHLWPDDIAQSFVKLGTEAAAPGFLVVLVKAVFAGWLIALMVWLMPAASTAKFVVIIAVTWLIAVAKFSHVIAASAETAFAAMQGAIGWDDYLIGFLIPALIGNSVGGVVFVALLNHAQVKAEI